MKGGSDSGGHENGCLHLIPAPAPPSPSLYLWQALVHCLAAERQDAKLSHRLADLCGAAWRGQVMYEA